MKVQRLLIGLLALTFAGCPKETSIWLAPGSSVDRLEFNLGEKRGERKPISIALLRVDPCAPETGRTMTEPEPAWIIEAVPGQAEKVASVTYGSTAAGFRQVVAAKPLSRPGCYLVTISGTGFSGFEVSQAGQIREIPKEELRQIDREIEL